MRNLTKDYTYTAGTRSITVAGEAFTVENIRLIVNETQKVVICSSMQKDNVSVTGNVITYSSSLPALQAGDKLTIELDNGVIPIFSANAEVAEGKEVIADNLTAMGVTASATESLTTLGEKVLQAGLNVSVTPLTNYPSVWHDLFTVMASVYDATKPYMYALLLNRSTPVDVMATFVDGEVVVSGGEADAGKLTKWVVFKRSKQNFNAAYNASYKSYLIGCSVYNADMFNVNFNGSFLTFIYYNSDYSVTPLRFNASQFYGTRLGSFYTPNVSELMFDYVGAFQTSTLSYVVLQSQQKSLTISIGNTWQGCSSLTSFTLPPNLTSLTISGSQIWYGCSSLTSFTMPTNLTSLTISGSGTWQGCSSLTSFTLPPNLTSLTISGSQIWYGCSSLTSFTMPTNLTSLTIGVNTWQSCSSLTRITLNPNWRLTANFSTAPSFTHDGIVLMFGELVDKRADGINPTTVATNSTSPIVTGTNSQFTKVFVVGDTININAAGNRTIASIDSDKQLTLTANAAATGTGLAYNINKTLTLGATNLARVSAAEIAVATAKGWTIN